MVVLFRTARQPIIYLAKPCSIATIFRALCLIIKFGAPVLICFFYLDYSAGYTYDLEKPTIYPGSVLSFVGKSNESDYSFSDLNSPNGELSVIPNNSIVFQTIPHYDGSFLDYWTISIQILEPDASKISYVSVLFDFTLSLRKWAKCTFQTIGSFTQSFPSSLNRITAFGDLILEQNEIMNFRGKYNENYIDVNSYSMHSDILENQNNNSYLSYVEWREPLVKYGYWYSFELNLRIYVRDIKVWHTIPLVSSIEKILTLYLSTVIMTSLILDSLQGLIFRKGFIKSWAIPLCEPPSNGKNHN